MLTEMKKNGKEPEITHFRDGSGGVCLLGFHLEINCQNRLPPVPSKKKDYVN